ncbi:MAG: xanthine dehydrogenase family protein subunit M [Gammaproteobacteria bacterium]|nr:xanthine dehydrogenase family protein subunit M [Gammaproteobacteria bacterium]
MKAAAFEYTRVQSLDEACALLSTNSAEDAETRVIAGGQTLVPLMAMRLSRPTRLVDINPIESLAGITALDGALRIGALTRQRSVERSALVAESLPLLAAAMPHVGHQQTRNRGTLGGSIVQADPSAEIPLVALLYDAELLLHSSRGERRLPAADFFHGPMVTAIAADEVLCEARFPIRVPTARGAAVFDEVAPRRGDYALVSVGVELALDTQGHAERISLGVGGCGPTPIRLREIEQRLTGLRPAAGEIDSALADLHRWLQPEDTVQASADYRRRVATRLLRRALLTAIARATDAGKA